MRTDGTPAHAGPHLRRQLRRVPVSPAFQDASHARTRSSARYSCTSPEKVLAHVMQPCTLPGGEAVLSPGRSRVPGHRPPPPGYLPAPSSILRLEYIALDHRHDCVLESQRCFVLWTVAAPSEA
ncbi:hypothetical protein K466DRAFT_30999 [Polyporus arcularius HHB13444]|uniref:Uncharacterized protein n=1 Tax=Polyporus arcularius HHB13444 TaxID=1314778 RepID=A0A5C3P0E1_9APHY|nr:hypothetical protein K466DRAFT_30999 [Polyporus arcularius HHB13444]